MEFLMKFLRTGFFVLLLCASFFATRHAYAWDDCPLGLENDPAPGECSSYVDTDKNSVCDRSEPAPENRLVSLVQASEQETETAITYDAESLPELSGKDLKAKSVSEVADFYRIDAVKFQQELDNFLNVKVKQSDTFQLLHDNYGMEPSATKDLVLNVMNDTPKAEIAAASNEDTSETKTEKTYFFGLISILLTIIYIASFVLSKLKKISVASHRKVWNILLLITFLVSAILGLLLTIRIQYGINFQLPFNMLFWHVEAGIAMSLISIFHILWHLPYYLNIFKKIKNTPSA
jgi:uncharacterized integral membrane protein